MKTIKISVVVWMLITLSFAFGEKRYVDNGDGTVTDMKSGLMWTQKDSYSDMGQFLTWAKTREYVAGLRTGGYDDWRIPTLEQLKTLYDLSFSVKSYEYEKGKAHTVHFSPVFASGGATIFWSSDEKKKPYWFSDKDAIGYYSFSFVNGRSGPVAYTSPDRPVRGGVRAVRLANVSALNLKVLDTQK